MGGYNHKPNDALVIYSGAEGGSEESTCGRGSKSNDTYLFLSGSDGGEDEFVPEGAVKVSHRHRSCGIMCLCEIKEFRKSVFERGWNMNYE